MPESPSVTLAQVVALRNGLDPVLAQLQSVLSVAYSQSLPIIGTKLSAAAASGEAALKKFQALEADVAAALDALADPAGYAAAQLQQTIGDAIARAGFAGTVAVTVDAAGKLAVAIQDAASATYAQALGTDFGIPDLSFSTRGTAAASIGYSVKLGVSVDANGTFAVADPSTPALNVTVDVSAPTFTADASLQNLKFDASDTGSALHGRFAIDTAGHATFSGDAALGLHLRSDLGSADFPSISADLSGSWHFDNSAIDPDNAATFGDAPSIGLKNVTMDLGTFFDRFLKPVLDTLKPVLSPIHTAVAVLNTDLTFLKGILGPAWHALDTAGTSDANGTDIGDGRLTLLDLVKDGARLSGQNITVSGLASFIGALDDVVNAIAFLEGVSLGPSSYNLGSFTISDDIRRADFSAINAALNVVQPGQTISALLHGIGGPYAEQAPGGGGSVADALLTILNNHTFAFPILDPGNLFKVLLGGTSDLFTFTPPAFTFPTVSATFLTVPVFPAINVVVNGTLQAAAGVGFGIDTKGLRDYANGGYADPGKLLDGLYITNPAVNGIVAPILKLAAGIGLDVEVGAPGFGIAGGGNIQGEVDFSLANPGKNYLGPLIAQLASDPLAAIDASGKITAGFEVGVKILGITAYNYDSPRITLASFDHHATPVVGPAPTRLLGAAITAIDRHADVLTGRETPGSVIRLVLSFSSAVIVPDANPPVLNFNSGGSASLNTTDSAPGNGKLVFDYAVLPSDTTIKTLGLATISGALRATDGNAVDLTALNGLEFPNVEIDTSEPRVFTAPTGLFDNQANFNRQFVSVVAGNGDELRLYGNATVNTGSTATFQQNTGDVNTLLVQTGGTLDMKRGLLRISGILDDSVNAGTIMVGPAELRLKYNLKNQGTLALGAIAGTPTLTVLGAAAQLYGGGQVVLGDSDANLVQGGPQVGDAAALPVLFNVDNTISGAGTIGGYAPDGSTGLDLVNKAAIVGSGTHRLRLLATTANTGTLSGTGTGGLAILGTVDNRGGTISASGAGFTTLGDKADVTGGTLSTDGGGRIGAEGTAALHGPVTQNAFLEAGAGATLLLTGAINQQHYTPPTADSARLSAGAGTLVLDGATILNGYVTSGAGGLVHVVGGASSIVGSNGPGQASPAVLTDAAVLVDRGASLGFSGAAANRGTVKASGTVSVSNALDNAGGTLQALSGGTVVITSGATLIGGTLATPGGSDTARIEAVGLSTLDGTVATVTNLGVLHAAAQPGINDPQQTLHLKGTVNQFRDGAAGTMIADNVDVVLDSAVLQNGTLAVVGSGRFLANGSSVLDGTSHGLTLPGVVSIQHGQSLTIRGDIVNAGSIAVDGYSGYGEALLLVSGATALTGHGTLRLRNLYYPGGDVATVTGFPDVPSTLENVDNTIVGFGRLGAGRLGIRNDAGGTIKAETSLLTLATGAAGAANQGLLTAATGATLRVEAAVDNHGGRILAADGGIVQLGGEGVAARVAGGTLDSAGTGAILVDNAGATLDGTAETVVNAAHLVNAQSRTLQVKGGLSNRATIELAGYSGYARSVLAVAGTVVLDGGGSVLLENGYYPGGDQASITGASTADLLDNRDNTISGFGVFGDGLLSLVNEAAGTIDATTSILALDTGAGAVANAGLMEATAGGTLDLRSGVANTGRLLAAATGQLILRAAVTGAGSVEVASGGTMLLAGGAVRGAGSLTEAAGGAIRVEGPGAIDATARTVVLAGETHIDHNAALTLTGPIGNAGTIFVDGYSGYSQALLKVAGTATLAGGGRVVLRNNYYVGGNQAAIIGASTADQLDNEANTISGYGEIGQGSLALVNGTGGTIDATSATLTIDTGSTTVSNLGLLAATDGGTLDLSSTASNAGAIRATGGTVIIRKAVGGSGTVLAGDDGLIVLDGGMLGAGLTVGTTLRGRIGVLHSASLDGTAHALALAGTLGIEHNATLTVSGTLANAGTINLDGYAGYALAVLQVSGTAVLDGGGTMVLRDNSGAFGMTSAITGVSAADTLDNRNNTITGYGELGSGGLGLLNEAGGIIDAHVGTLHLRPGAGPAANRGLMQATAGGTLLVAGAVDNKDGRILAAAGSVVRLGGDGLGATVAGGRIEGAGTGQVLVDSQNATIDATSQAVTSTAAISVGAARVLTLTGALFNTATINLNGTAGYSSTTLNVSGTAILAGGGTVQLRDTYGASANVASIRGSSSADVLDNFDNTIIGYGELGSGAMSFTNDNGGTVDAAAATLAVDTGATATLNRGLMEATAGGTLELRSGVANAGRLLAAATGQLTVRGAVANTGRIDVAAGGRLLLAGGALRGAGSLEAVAGSTVEASGAAVIDGTAQAVSLAGTTHVDAASRLTLSGSIGNGGAIMLDGYAGYAASVLAVAGTTRLAGGGSIVLRDAYGANAPVAEISGAGLADTLDNVDNSISGYGRLGNGAMSLTNEARGSIRATAATLQLDTGAAVIGNAGTLAADGGTLRIASAVRNTGLIEAKAGTVIASGLVSGGTIQADAGQQVLLSGGVAGSTLAFNGAGGSIIVGNSGQPISGTVRGLADGDVLDFQGIAATSTYAGGVLTLSSGGTAIGSLAIAGATAADSFVAQSDGAGGTRIVHQAAAQQGDIEFTDVVTNTSGKAASAAYDGPVDYLRHQYIWASPDSVAISASAPSSFLKGGAADDALMVRGGNNVLDGGAGSNFLIGGDGSDGGKDVFFVDSTENVQTWGTIVGFHKGDLATIFGFHPGLSTRPYTDSDGAAGYSGVTIHSEIDGPGTGVKASMTFAGISREVAEAHFDITTGSLPESIDYMLIEYR